ncbi:unnamed protein product [Chrysodeixis includens]|uniref:C2H2-type domain-containing protein n=1 Tax=Chrysodeixis includens TaxID=689277 RepID=A0A9P0BW52_CHRIL|nr:unnamed protein product [Chrysodeixis includens]
MDEKCSPSWNNDNKEQKSEWTKHYCFGCLCDNKEENVHNYSFQCGPLKEIFQMDCILLCHLCKRLAQRTEMFIQNVQSNHILLENFQSVLDESLNSVRAQTQPLVNLTVIPLDSLELSETSPCSDEMFSVVYSSNMRKDVQVKMEMKEEELFDDIEAEFIGGDEFSETCVKEEEEFPLKVLLKEELELGDIDSLDLLTLSATLKKNKLKKKHKIKDEKPDSVSKANPKIKIVYLTKEQCLDERPRLAQDPKYLGCAYKCEECIKGFSFKGSYDKHMERHSQYMGDHECDVCHQRMDSEEKLMSHMRYHLIRYKCPECGLVRNCRGTILDHYVVHHCQGFNHTCPHCGKSFLRRGSLRRHVSYAHGARERVTCAHCHKRYANAVVLRSHMLIKHAKEVSAGEVSKKYVCQECGMAFKAPSQLKNHSIKHSDNRDYYCVECDKSFKSDAILKNHLKTASKHVNYLDLPFGCPQCDKRFSIRRDLERHMNRMHLNIKPYTCDRCDKAYTNSWGLKDHKRLVHEGYKRPLQYPCTMCDKVFDRSQILKSHIRTHTGERPYQCSKCPAQFTQASILRTHDKLIHLKLTRDGRPKVK